MEEKAKNDLTKVIAIIATVIASNLGVDFSQSRRFEDVKEDVSVVEQQNREIIESIANLFDERLTSAVSDAKQNKELNNLIIEMLRQNRENTNTLVQEVQTQLKEIKALNSKGKK